MYDHWHHLVGDTDYNGEGGIDDDDAVANDGGEDCVDEDAKFSPPRPN